MKSKLRALSLLLVLVLLTGILSACEVNGSKLSHVSITKESAELSIGESIQLTAYAYTQIGTAQPTRSESIKISWFSTNEDVATVDQNGVVTAISNGVATIIASAVYNGVEKTADCDITVSIINVDEIYFESDTYDVAKNYSITLEPIFVPKNATNKKLTWISSDESIATVVDGVVTGKAVGTARITATTEDGKKIAVCTVNVKIVSLISISMPEETVYVAKGATTTVKVTFYPTNSSNKNLKWSSSNLFVATVNEKTGVITGRNMGSTTITATSEDGNHVASCTLIVTEPSVTNMVITPSTPDVYIGKSITLSAFVYPTDATDTYTWFCSDESVVKLSSTNGKEITITGLKEGTATITCVTGTNKVTATCVVNVKILMPTSIVLSAENVDVIVPKGFNSKSPAVYASVYAIMNTDAMETEVEWVSSNEKVFVVIPTGNRSVLLKIVGQGTATLTALTTNSNVYASCNVNVGELLTNAEGLANAIEKSLGGETIFLDAIEYTLGSDVTLRRSIRIVGVYGATSHTVINSSFSSRYDLTLENIELRGTVNLEKTSVSKFKNVIINSIASGASAITMSNTARLFVEKSIIKHNAGKSFELFSNAVIVLKDSTYDSGISINDDALALSFDSLEKKFVMLNGKIGVTKNSSYDISEAVSLLLPEILAQHNTYYLKSYATFEMSESEHFTLTTTGSSRGTLTVSATAPIGSEVTVNVKYQYGSKQSEYYELEITFIVVE
jgi:uncharacterized protein YjdB